MIWIFSHSESRNKKTIRLRGEILVKKRGRRALFTFF
jgi:hypothetical protein